MALNHEELNKFRIQKEKLGGMLSEAATVVNELNMTSAGENLVQLGEKVNNDTFKIMVIGTFKHGKSTFINSLLGEEVLPAYARPTTAVINEVKYSEEKRAILHFRNPLPEKLPESISSKALQHMQEHNMQDVPAMEIPYTEIEDYVTIPISNTDIKEMLLESPYEKVELFWPLDMLKEGVEIIDSPGLNEAATRTKVTTEYLSKADAILFVMNAQALCSLSEMDFIENTLNASGFNDIFFVVNRWDCIRDREKEDMKKFAHLKLDQYTTNEIFFVSAQNALDGELKNNTELYNGSGMPAFTEALTGFLTKDKGKIKLSQPARELKRILNNEALYKVIPSQRSMLDCSLNDLKERYEKAKPQLEALKTRKEQVVTKINLRIEQSKHEFRRAVLHNTNTVTEMIPAWVAEFQPTTKFDGFLKPSDECISKVISEIVEHVQAKVEEQQKEWKKEVLIPLAQEKSQSIFEMAETDLSRLLNDIDSIRVNISGNHSTTPAEDVPVWERIVGAVAGFLGGDIAGAISGGAYGLSKELAKSIAINIGGAVLLGILGLLNPFTGVLLAIATLIGGSIAHDEKILNQMKQNVTNEFVKQLSNNADDNADEIAGTIADGLSKVTNGISKALDQEIGQVEKEIQGIIDEMTKGEKNINDRKKVITSCETKIREISSDLDAFTFELLEQN